MKKYILIILFGSFWAVSCQNEPAKAAVSEAQNAPILANPAPVVEPSSSTPEQKPIVETAQNPATPDPKPAAANPKTNGQMQSVSDQKTNPGNQTKPTTIWEKLKPRAPLPDDAMCFVARETDGRVFELRLAMVDEKKVMGDLLIYNIQTGEFVQGKINGERREKTQFVLTWAFDGADKIRHITSVAYLLQGEKLIQKSRDVEDEGRVFSKIDCGKMK